jgi:dethiobiotin synthetase
MNTTTMSHQTVFITATDTDAGKTYVSSLLLQGLKQLHHSAIGVKPIAAGGNAAGENEDALILQQHSYLAVPSSNALPLSNVLPTESAELLVPANSAARSYSWFNPIFYQQAVAPHLAAELKQQPICEQVLNRSLQDWQQAGVELCVIEGAGGWLLPLNQQRYLADWVAEHQLPVIVVIAIKLGCLNHAMLTIREIERSGCTILGWVANCVDPVMPLLQQNIQDLQQRISQPCLAVLPWLKASKQASLAEQQCNTQHAKQLAKAVLAVL